jgi:signal transduction histidine kinase
MIIAMAIDTTTRRAHERSLKEKEAQLQQINVDLEDKISKRTRNLEEKTLLLEKMAMELSQVEQRERRSLASRLHDDLQQIIASARFRLDTYSRQHGEEDNEILAKVQTLLMDAIKACRNITSNLAPSVLYDSGLFKALNWVCHNFKDRHGLEVACHIPEFAEDNFDRDKSIFIFQSVKELLFNVVKHAETGHASLTCDQDYNGCLHIRIQDKGVGFDPEKIRENMSRSGGGYGLLSIQQRIAYIGGKVKIISEPGRGTCVDIHLPRQAGITTECNDQFPQKKIRLDNALRQVMIVDDHPIFREGLKSLLESEEDIIITGEASGGKEAVEKVIELNPDVVLMDVNLPEMNGIQATQEILKSHPDVQIIGLSINAEEESSEAMFAAGAHAYLPKGGLASELIKQIRKK